MVKDTSGKISKGNVNKKDIIKFSQGMSGFEDFHEYVLLQENEDVPVMELQSLVENGPSFVVFDPFAVVSGFAPELSKQDLEFFGKNDSTELRYVVIGIVSSIIENTLVNLKAPVVIDPITKKAKQVILENNSYPLRYSLFSQVSEETAC